MRRPSNWPEAKAFILKSGLLLREVDRIERAGAAMLPYLRGRRETYPVSEAFARQFRQM